MGKADNYRSSLGKYLHKEIVLDCDCFEVIRDNDRNGIYILLQRPNVVSLEGYDDAPSLEIDHLWIRVPDKDTKKIIKNRFEATTIRVQGSIKGYVYRGSGQVQVGVIADRILILECLDDIWPSEKETILDM